MKKILISLMLIVCLFMLVGCSSHKVSEDSNYYGYFIEVAQHDIPGARTIFMYDPITKVVYVEIRAGYHAGFSVYYVVINGKPEVALYGINWTETDLKGV